MDVVIAVDTSGDLQDPASWSDMQDFLKLTLSRMDISSSRMHVSVVIYGDTLEVLWDLDEFDVDDMEDAIDDLSVNDLPDGDRDTDDAIQEIVEDIFDGSNGDRNGVKNYLVLITDGENDRGAPDAIEQADDARDADVFIYSVGVGDEISVSTLSSMAANPWDYVIVDDYENIDTIADSVLSGVDCNCRDTDGKLKSKSSSLLLEITSLPFNACNELACVT